MLYTHGKPGVTLAELRTGYTVPSVGDLRAVRKGANGNRWKPIHHADLIEEIHGALDRQGYGVRAEAFALSEDRHDIFGSMQIEGIKIGDRTDMAPVLGFRSSNVQRFRLLGVSGSRVFVCDNGAIVGDFVFGMNHTSGNMEHVEVKIDEGVGNWRNQIADMHRLVEFLETTELSRRDSDHLLIEAGRRGVVAWNQLGKIEGTYNAYEAEAHPHHSAFAGRNAWSLYNAVTEVAKGWTSPRIGERGLKGFPRVIAEEFGFNLAPNVDTDTVPSLN